MKLLLAASIPCWIFCGPHYSFPEARAKCFEKREELQALTSYETGRWECYGAGTIKAWQLRIRYSDGTYGKPTNFKWK